MRGRQTPTTAHTITHISEGYRAMTSVFLRDGHLDPEERHVQGLFRQAAGAAAWSDWGRRAAISYADTGKVNDRLLRERDELTAQYGDEPSEAA